MKPNDYRNYKRLLYLQRKQRRLNPKQQRQLDSLENKLEMEEKTEYSRNRGESYVY